jgi:hypothetical protein
VEWDFLCFRIATAFSPDGETLVVCNNSELAAGILVREKLDLAGRPTPDSTDATSQST